MMMKMKGYVTSQKILLNTITRDKYITSKDPDPGMMFQKLGTPFGPTVTRENAGTSSLKTTK
jgi:hypothetical protein